MLNLMKNNEMADVTTTGPLAKAPSSTPSPSPREPAISSSSSTTEAYAKAYPPSTQQACCLSSICSSIYSFFHEKCTSNSNKNLNAGHNNSNYLSTTYSAYSSPMFTKTDASGDV